MIDLTVKTLDSQNHAFSLDDDQITVRGFKEYIAESVAVPADSQRLIYCGRVLQDEKKLNDYDVNGKVIHLVQRAPPQAGQRSGDGSQAHVHNHGQVWQNSQRSHYRVTRAQMHGNAMYVGAMSVPAEVVEGHGLPVPQLSNSLSNSRLIVARRMLDRVNEIVDRLDDPSRPPPNPSSTESQPVSATQVQELETEQEDNNGEGRANRGARLAQAAAAAIAAALSAAGANNVTILGGTSDEGNESRATGETHDDSQADSQQQQTQQQQQHQPPQADREGSLSTADGQSNRRTTPQFPRPPQMAELLERLNSTQDRLRPYIERYRVLMFADPSLPPGSGPEGVEESQRIVDGVSESLHYMSHACHALSDIIVDMGQQPPRNLRCRPILLPFQVEAHISLHGRNANNNNTNEEASDAANVLASDAAESSEPVEVSTEDANQQESDNMAQPQAEQQQQRGQEQAQSPFGTVFNLQNNVEVLMEVSPENNVETAAGTGSSQNNENNNNNNNGRISGTATFPWGSAPPPEFIRNIMQAVAGHMVQGGITTVTTRNPPATAGQSVTTSLDSGTSNAGQSTQARSNVGTHPTTATQTRSTSRPHVFHQHPHPLGVGMGIGQGLDFDPFLPCNSHHVRRTPSTTPNTVNATPQAARSNHTSTTETQTEAQTANTSTINSNTNPTDAASSTSSQATNNNPFVTLLQQILGGTSGQPQASISINSNVPELAESLGNMMQMLVGRNIHVGIVGDGSGSSVGGGFTVADLLQSGGLSMESFTSHETDREENFLVDLTVLMAQNMTLEGLIRLRLGQREPVAYLRRPLQEFFQYWFSSASSPEALQEQATERLFSQIRPYLQNLLATEYVGGRSGSRIDICATVEALLSRHTREILRLLFDNDVDDDRFGQEILSTANTLGRQLCAVLRYSVRGGQAGLEAIASRFMMNILDRTYPTIRQWMLNSFIVPFRTYSLRVPQPPDSEIIPLLVYKDVPSQTASSTPLTAANQTSQPQSEHEPMETETIEERSNNDVLIDNGEEIPETFPGHEVLPSDWVPIIARDGVRQRRQLQMQGTTNGGVTPFSDAYLGGLPTKRRKLIEQQKSRLLVSPTPNHSVITASVERLVREGMGRAGVQEVEGAAVAVAADPGVRRTFGRAIRDCLNPRRYGTPDFPDPLRFPNATKYFTEKETPPK